MPFTGLPCLVVDLDVVRDNYRAFEKALPDTRVFYAVKANPAPEILSLLASLGSCFDTASVAEIEMALEAGATADRISFGNTIKKERDIAAPSRSASACSPSTASRRSRRSPAPRPARKVFCRILTDGEGAEWPLSRKFGCEPEMAVDVLEHAHRARPRRHGVSFHVGSQQRDPRLGRARWPRRRRSSATLRRARHPAQDGQSRRRLPDRYLKDVPAAKAYGQAIFRALRKHFGNRIPETIIEPGRGMVGDAGVIKAEVVLISRRRGRRQCALGLSRHRQVRRPRRDDGRGDPLPDPHPARRRRTAPCVLAGPTCDSADVLYEKTPYPLPVSLTIGDEVLIEGTGAYTTTYSSVASTASRRCDPT
jgi:ornithine decarboxylase